MGGPLGIPQMESLFNITEFLFSSNLAHRSEHEALVLLSSGGKTRSWTYAELWELILKGSRFFRQHCQPSEIILLRLPSDPSMVTAFFAAIHAGVVPVPISPMLTASEVEFLARDSQAGVAVLDPQLSFPAPSAVPALRQIFRAERLMNGAPRSADAITLREDPAFLVYTSGTTGRPRGVLHAQRSILGRLPMREAWTGLGPDDRLLHAGQLNWTYTLGVGIMDTWAAGGTAFVYAGERDRPALWYDLLREHEITLFASVPGLYRRLLKYANWNPASVPFFRHGLTAGDTLLPDLHAEWTHTTGVPLYEALGMSEISTFISSGPTVPTRPGSPGRPQPGRHIAILDEAGSPVRNSHDSGRLAIHRSDPGLMLGYLNAQARGPGIPPLDDADTASSEWFISGDMGRLDADGYFWHEGRSDDMMNAGGYRVSPGEVERVLHEHPSIEEAAVVETDVPGRRGVSIITAFVVPKRHNLSEKELLGFCSEQLASYKCPRRVVFLEHLPRNAAGKLDRRKLRSHT